MNTWQEWFAEQRARSAMSVEVVSLAEVGGGWGMQEGGAHYGREDGKFFRLMGVKITTAGREVMSWGQPMLEETGGPGAVVVIKARGEERFLLAAKSEPGNPREGCVMLAAPFQASKANLEQAHGGKRPSRAELLDGGGVKWVGLTQDGGRFFCKENAYAVVEADPDQVTLTANERWFSREELREAYLAGELNEHLILALMGAVL